MTVKSQIRSIMGIMGPENQELCTLELGKISEFDFAYILASTNINLSLPNLVKINTTIRSWVSSIIDLIGQN